jgi:DNA-directed RNA polymerase specialized sigma24 family protein
MGQRLSDRLQKELARSEPEYPERLVDPARLVRLSDRLGREAEPTGPDESPETTADRVLMVEDLRLLDPLDRLVVLAVFWGGISLRTTARLLHIDDKTARRASDRAKVVLRGVALSRLATAAADAAGGS